MNFLNILYCKSLPKNTTVNNIWYYQSVVDIPHHRD